MSPPFFALGGQMPNVLGNNGFINKFLGTVGVLAGSLAVNLQNGNSTLGTLSHPTLPEFLPSPNVGRSVEGRTVVYPWGERTALNANPYVDVPTTGVTRYYDFTISRGYLSPDGTNTSLILINGQYPGPTIEANWGDYIQVTVRNKLQNPLEGTAMHWHGLTQKATPWYDGVASVSQCPIAPGNKFVYNFQADLYGTSWYHSHYSAQYSGGLFGPMVIYGPNNYPASAGSVIDLGPIVVTDFFHTNYLDIVNNVMSSNKATANLVFSDNSLIQGKGNTDCANAAQANCTTGASLAKFMFTPGQTHRLRFINTASSGLFIVSLDGHQMTVIANDYVPVTPYTVSQIILNVGQRTDVLVTANQFPGAYWLRTRQPTTCALSTQPYGLAAVYYSGTNTNFKPLTLPNFQFTLPVLSCGNDALSTTVPTYPITPGPPDVTVFITIAAITNATGQTVYTMNGQTFRGNYNYPLLLETYEGNTSYPLDPQWNVYNFGDYENVRIVFQNTIAVNHPMHIHGQNMFVLAEGTGSWDNSTIINPSNPQRRDTQTLQANGYLVVQLASDNPGVWPFHCHISWHVSQGLYMNVMQKPDLVNQTQIPTVMKQTCRAWNKYASQQVVDEVDSGLKM